MPEPFLSIKNVCKRFPGILALDSVDLEIMPGEIHALLGENGSGKSTLAKIIAGIYVPDSGEIFVEGVKRNIASPEIAMGLGIYYVSQSPLLVDDMTVAENVALALKDLGPLSRVRKIEELVRRWSSSVGIHLDPKSEVSRLSYTQKQLLEIFKAIVSNARLLILDEVTTLLPRSEKEIIYSYIKRLKSEGRSVVLITHRIVEAVEIADRLTVLKGGRKIATLDNMGVKPSADEIRKMMFGENSVEVKPALSMDRDKELSEVVLELSGAVIPSDHRGQVVEIDKLRVYRGEIIGVAGIAGNGQKELVEALAGLRRISRGRYKLLGIDVTNKGTKRVRSLGVGIVTEMPLYYSMGGEASIEENMALGRRFSYHKISWDSLRKEVVAIIKGFRIATSSPRTPVNLLSGGNLMKVHLAKELSITRNLLIAYNPTRALDEATARFVRGIIRNLAHNSGVAVLLVSEDLDEVLELSDKIVVLNAGRVVGEFTRDIAERSKIEELMVMH
ncbi:MAG TPA: ATP-binding cassette domain-containing protein [Sulfolobales archaeon]|nr:ATP-binding cassette domain-containing protein [Sulfolobales archaeon]